MIEGYCSATSVFPGEEIGLHVSSTGGGEVRVEVRRLPSDEVVHATSAPCGEHAVPPQAHARGCGWPAFVTLTVPEEWRSGVYCADLMARNDETAKLFFVVKSRKPSSPVLLSVAVATYEAYNYWPAAAFPGKSLYLHDSPERSCRVSFDRPDPWIPETLSRWEGAFLRWAAAEGLAIDCCTSVDLHRDPGLLSRYQLLVSVGHDEYWSKEMRDNVEHFVTRGGNAAFFSGNTCLWQIRLEDDERTVVCYRNPMDDPLRGVEDERVTTVWWVPPVERPPNTLTGVSSRNGGMYVYPTEYMVEDAVPVLLEDAAYRVCFPEHWVFDGAPLAEDGTFGRGEKIIGYEIDAAEYVELDGVPRATGRDGTPESFVILASADMTSWRGHGMGGYATMGIFCRNGTVFTAATVDWTLGLEHPGSAVPQITRNVIRRLSHRIPADTWQLIGEVPELWSMASFMRKLFAIGRDGRLWHRDATAQNVRWRDMGPAKGLVALASTEVTSGCLVGARDGALCWRDALTPDGDWSAFDDLTIPVVDMTGINTRLFAVAEEGLWARTPAIGRQRLSEDSPEWVRTAAVEMPRWRRIDDAEGVVALDSYLFGDRLFALTRHGLITSRNTEAAGPAPWETLDDAPDGAYTIGAVEGRLVVATAEGQLWWRPIG